jgi:hypothetical protein
MLARDSFDLWKDEERAEGTRRDLNEAAPGASVQKFSPLKECHEMLCRSSV